MITSNKKIFELLKHDSPFFISSIIYSIAISVFSLAIPLIVQALVNSVTFVIVKWPIGLLSLILFGVLILTGLLFLIQFYVVEKFQEHFYSRITGNLGIKLLNIDLSKKYHINVSEKVNYYFEVMTIQKSILELFVRGFPSFIQVLSGLFYSQFITLIFLFLICYF
jgi:putative ABC transport system ATP-binding protein